MGARGSGTGKVGKLGEVALTSYELEFLESALKWWKKLDVNTREQFKKKLAQRLQNPKVPSAKLRGSQNRY
jgi:mRNA interferase RelE/StbE